MISKIYYSIVGFFIIITLVACELFTEGYGDKVDLSNPELTIDSPSNGEYVNGQFILKGTASDDTGISSVVVEFVSSVTGETQSYTAEYSDSNWYLEINSSNDTVFEDGEVEFTVKVNDTASKNSSKNRIVYIDNTLPTVVVSTPDSDEVEIINGDLVISGEVEDQKIDRVEVYLVSTTDSSITFGGVADGTSSWDYEIDTIEEGLGVDSEESYYLEVTAYDAAGNSNSYFYYNDDLSSVKSSLGVTSVTMDVLTDSSNSTILSSIQRSSSYQLIMNIDQYQDTPKFVDLDEWNLDESDNYTKFTTDAYIYGRVTDDDGIESIVLSIYNNDGDDDLTNDTLARQGTIYPNGDTDFSIEVAIESASWSSNTDYQWEMMSGLTGGSSDLVEASYYFTMTVKDIEYSTAADNPGTGIAQLTNPGYFGIDKNAPVVEITSIENITTGYVDSSPASSGDYINSNFIISGTVTDGVHVEMVLISVDNGDDEEATLVNVIDEDTNDDKTWSYTVETDSDISETIEIYVTAYDAASDDDNVKTDTDFLSIYVDKIIPVLNDTDVVYPDDVNGTITISGKATDSQLDYIEYSVGDISGTLDPDGSSWSFELDTVDLFVDEDTYNAVGVTGQDFDLDVWAFDDSGNKSADLDLTLNVKPSSDLPTVTFDSVDNKYTTGSSISGTAEDDDGISGTGSGNIVITFYNESGDTELQSIEAVQTYNKGTVVGWSSGVLGSETGLDLDEGLYQYTVSVKDTHTENEDGSFDTDQTYTSSKIDFTIDNGEPTLTETEINSSSLKYINSDIILTGKATDGTGISSLTISINGSATEDLSLDTGNNWSYTFDTDTYADDDYEIIIVATDNAASSSTLTRNIIVDTTGPSITTYTVDGDSTTDSTPEFAGTISDYSVGLPTTRSLTVDYEITDNVGDTSTKSETITTTNSSWSGDLDFGTNEGSASITVTSTDKLGNGTITDAITLYYDASAPTLTETNVNSTDTIYVTGDQLFSGTISDSNKIKSLEVSLDGGENYTDITDTSVSGSTWTYTFSESDETTYIVMFRATDIANKKTIITRNIAVDTTNPTLVVTDFVNDYAYGLTNISGTISDNIGVDYVKYQLVDNSWETASLTWDSTNSRYNWKGSVELTTESTFTLNVEAKDKAGNSVTNSTRSIVIDASVPVLTETTINTTDSAFAKDTVSFGGTASDTHLESLKVYIDSVEITPAITVEADNSWVYTTDSELEDGDHTVIFTALDSVNRETSVTRNITIDSVDPVVTVDDILDSSVYGLINITGSVSDENIQYVKYKLDSGTLLTATLEWNETNNNYDWSGTVTASTEGTSTITVIAYDKAENEHSDITDSFKVDQSAPVLTETTVGTSDSQDINSIISLAGTASDTNELVDVKVYIGTTLKQTTLKEDLTSGTDWSYTLDADDGYYAIQIIATDSVGKTTELLRNFLVDTVGPTISTTTVDGASTLISAPTISGSIIDYSAGLPDSRVITVNYTITDNTGSEITGSKTIETTTSSWSGTFDFDTTDNSLDDALEGSASITLTSEDKLGNSTTTDAITLYYDASNPILTETEINTTDTIYIINDQIFSGTVSDTNEIKTLEVSLDSGVNYTDISDNITDEDWTYTFAADTDDSSVIDIADEGEFSLIFKATDVAGKTATKSRNIVVDLSKPTVSVADISSYVSGTISISGEASDSSSGVELVEYQLDSIIGTWIEASGTKNWLSSIDLSSVDEGSRTLYVKSTDYAGNSSNTVNTTIKVDKYDPKVTIAADSTESNSDITISGTSTDSNSLVSTKLYWSLNDGAETEVEITPTGDDGDWNWTLVSTNGDGDYDIRVVATDIAGKTDEESVSVTLDTTAPVLVIDANTSEYYTSAYSVSGTSVDSISGVASVEYSIDNSTWLTDLSGTSIWFGSVDISTLAVGSNTLYLRTTDKLGNVSSVATQTFIKDTDLPLSGTVLTDWTTPEYKDANFTLSGTATDDNGITSVSITGDGLASEYISYTAAWSTEITPTVQGSSELTLTITDGVGRITTESLTYFFDNVDPVVSVTNVPDNDLISSKSYTFLGTAIDSDGSGISTVEYRFNSTDDADWASVVGTDTWSLTKTELTDSSSHTMEFRSTDKSGRTSGITSVDFTVDTNVPVIGDITADRETPFDFDADDSSTALVYTNQAYGGSSSVFALKVLAKDTIGLDSVTIEIPGLSDTAATTDGSVDGDYEVWKTESIDISGLSDGTAEWVVTVVDTSGLESTSTKTVLIDNTVPVITYTYPGHLDDIVNGEVEVKGLGEDDGSGLSTVQYKIGYTPSNETWVSVDGSTFSWEIPFTDDGIGKIDNYAGLEVDSITSSVITLDSHGYSDGTPIWVGADNLPAELSSTTTYYVVSSTTNTFELSTTINSSDAVTFTSDEDTVLRVSKYSKDSDDDSIWELPVLIKATDKAGNEYLGLDTTYVIKVDPSGDKANVSIVYPAAADSDQTMGGIIRIFGTATDDDGVDSVYMQIDVDGDGDFESDDIASDTDATDWYNGNEGQLVDGSASWNMSINTEGEFDSETAGEQNLIHFRVRAKDIYGTFGPWSESQQIIIDNDVPTIGSSQAATLINGDASKAYVADIWIKDSWTLYCSIEDESDISRVVVSSDEIDSLNFDLEGSEIVSDDMFEDYTGSSTYGYLMSLPIDTTILSGSSLSITVTAYDNSTDKSSSSTSFSINYDNDAPTMQDYEGSTPVEQSNNSYELTSSVTEDGSGLERVAFYFLRQGSDDTLDRIYNPLDDETHSLLGDSSDVNRLTYITDLDMTGPLPRLSITDGTRDDYYSLTDDSIKDNYNVRVGGLIEIGGIDRLITEVDYTNGIVTWGDSVALTYVDASIAYAFIVDNFTIETPVWDDDTLDSITNDDNDFMVESIERSGGLYDWSASVDSKNIPDGPIEIHWVAYDESGNYATNSVSTQILNNRPKLAKVTLGTDLDGDGTVSSDEKEDAYSLTDGDGENQAEATASSSSFIAKDLTTIDIDVVGGNGELQYTLSETNLNRDLTTLRSDESADINSITLTGAELTTITDGDKTFTITIWDSTEETTIGTDSQWAELTLPFNVDYVDGVAPVGVISPFFWNSETDNSLYNNSSENGHIELVGVLDGEDPDISGQVSIRGTAYDDQRIDSLTVTIDGMSMTASTSVNNLDGTWSSAGTYETDGWVLTVADTTLDQSGHEIEWQLDWNTKFITNVADTDVEITLEVEDKGNNNNLTTTTEDSDVTINNIPNYFVDVVPYITEVSTPLRTSGGLKDQNIRSASGKYSIITGSDSSFINVYGFNINPNAVRIIDSATVDGNSVTTTSGNEVSYQNSTTDYDYIELTNNISTSGYLEIFTNGIRSINNINDNDAEGSESGYNSEADLYVVKNKLLNDDRYFRLFSIKDTDVKNGYYADMLMNGNNPVFSYLDLNGGPNSAVGTAAGTGAGSYRYQNAMPQRAEYNSSTGAEVYTEYLTKGLSWDQMSMARDDGGRYYHLSMHNYDGATMDFMYDRYAELYTNGMGWGTGIQYSGYSGEFSSYSGNNAIALEDTDYGNGLLLGRYQFPKIQTVGDSTTGDASVYMLYYDDNTTNQNLIFRNFKVGTTTSLGNTMNSSDDDSSGVAYAQYTNLADYNTSGRLTAASNASKYFDFVVTSGNIVVIVYYDEDAGSLKLVYSDSAVDGSNPTSTITWNSSPITLPDYIGNYVSMEIDSTNAIHISAYDSSDSDLSYLYIPDFTSTTYYKSAIDSSFSVGTWSNIKIKESGGDIIPYIAYCNSSEYGSRDVIKLAYSNSSISESNIPEGVDDDGYTTGDWEYMNIPSITAPQAGDVKFKQVNLDFNSSGKPVLGYLGTNLEFGYWLDE